MSSNSDLITFAEQAAHDLNNPLAAISMAVEMAMDEAPAGSQEVITLLERVQGSVARLASMIDDLPNAAATWTAETASEEE